MFALGWPIAWRRFASDLWCLCRRAGAELGCEASEDVGLLSWGSWLGHCCAACRVRMSTYRGQWSDRHMKYDETIESLGSERMQIAVMTRLRRKDQAE